jgi:general secretion pathway protein M
MIDRLSPRDRLALAVGAGVVLVAVLLFGIYLPYRGALAGLDDRIAARQRQVEEVGELRARYQLLQQQLGVAERRLAQGEQVSLFPFVEELAGRFATKENLIYMRPQPPSTQGEFREESVEIRLEKVRLGQLVQLLFAIDSAPAALKVKNLRIMTGFDDRTLLDSVLTIASFRRGA